MKRPSFPLSTLGPRRARPAVLGLVLLLLATAPAALAQSSALERAKETYRTAKFDEAIALFTEVIKDPATDKGVKKEAYQYLGRLYVAKNAYDEARAVITDLLDLEPPLVELNPDMEPPPLMKLYYEVRKDYTESYAVEKADPGMHTLAVMDFTNSSVDDHERFEPLQQGFASMVINHLSGVSDLKVIERERIEWLLDELALQRTEGVVDQSSAVRTGKLLGAHAVLFGAFTVHKKDMWISARLVKVETGEILLAEQIFGKKDDFFELIEKLSLQVAQASNSLADAGTIGAKTETKSLDAMMSYSEGLSELDRGNYQEAYQKFMEAQKIDPSYTRAALKAESIRPLMASATAQPDAASQAGDTGGD